ncbi:U3 snoRNP protein, partial [Perkinsus olseni]
TADAGTQGDAEKPAQQPAWVDEDDDASNTEVDLTSHNRLKKLRSSRDEVKVSVREYEARLRDRFTQMSGRQDWAQAKPVEDEDSDDEFIPSLNKASDPTKLAIRRVTNVCGRPQHSGGYGPITVLAWHPKEDLLLSANRLGDSFRLNKVDGKKNTEVYSAKLKDFQIESATFLNSNEVAAVGPQGTVCLFDVNKQSVTAVKGACGTSRKDRKLWSISALGGKSFAMATQGGEVLVSDTRSRKLAAKFQLGAPASVVMWHPTNNHLICADGRANVYEWDVGTRRCLSKVHDDLAVSITCGATFDHGLAFGTSSGTLDVVDIKEGGGLGGFRTVCESLVNPLTAVCSLRGKILLGATNAKNSAIRATNAVTGQTYSNWPTTISNLGRVESVAAKDDWLAMGNSRGQVMLFTVGYDQLEGLTNSKLLQRCRDLRDRVGSSLVCPRIPRQSEAMIRWIIATQCKISGQEPWDFGCPETIYDKARDRSPFRIQPTQKFHKEGGFPSSSSVGGRGSEEPPFAADELDGCFDWTWKESAPRRGRRPPAADTKEDSHAFLSDQYCHDEGLVGERDARWGGPSSTRELQLGGFGRGDGSVGGRVGPQGAGSTREQIGQDEERGLESSDVCWDDPVEPLHRPEGRRHARPSVEGWHDHVFGNTSRRDPGQRPWGRKMASPEAEGWEDHFANDGVGNVKEPVHGMRHADATTEGWSDHIQAGTVAYGDTDEDHPRGRGHHQEGNRDHMIHAGEAEGPTGRARGRGRPDWQADFVKDHIDGGTVDDGILEKPRGRVHAGSIQEGWKDHIVDWTAGDSEQARGRRHGTAMQEGWVDHFDEGTTAMRVQRGRGHPTVPII